MPLRPARPTARPVLPALAQLVAAAAVVVAAAPGMARASSPDAWAALERDASRACAAASGLRNPLVTGTTIRFDDTLGVDARLVSGTWPQPHMKGAQALMLCLYDRRARRAQVQDAEAWRVLLGAAAPNR
jgi:hypothetical protein